MLPAFLSETELPPRPLLAALHVTANVAAGGGEQRMQGQTAAHIRQTEGRNRKGRFRVIPWVCNNTVPGSRE